MCEYKIAIYIRLSMADEETGKSKEESNSVVNQRSLIHQYLDKNKELSGYPRVEFVDDGFTGTNTSRPAFQNMVKQIKDGKYNLCITKDFSRFSRDYIEMGDYLECVFPFLGVRYISINDGYDSLDYKGTTGGLDVVMRAIVYDAYSKDLSAKASASKRQSQKKGLRIGGHPAFGYRKHPDNPTLDVIDPEAAEIVRRIFDEAIGGTRLGEIVKMLNSENIITPAKYFKKKYPEMKKYKNMSEKSCWTYSEVYQIIKRYCYTGAAVAGTRKALMPCKRNSVRADFDEWIIVPDMHEAIITSEEYEQAQRVIVKQNKDGYCLREYPLKSLVYCGNCNRKLVRRDNSPMYFCPYGRNNGDAVCRQVHTTREEELEKIVYMAIVDFIENENREKEELKKLLSKQKTMKTNDKDTIEGYRKQIEILRDDKLLDYEKYVAGAVDKKAYIELKREIDGKIEALEDRIKQLDNYNKALSRISEEIYSEEEAVCEAFCGETKLTYDMAHAFVEKIIVSPDDRLEIVLKFKNHSRKNEKENV